MSDVAGWAKFVSAELPLGAQLGRKPKISNDPLPHCKIQEKRTIGLALKNGFLRGGARAAKSQFLMLW
jgi:hypothetical protein